MQPIGNQYLIKSIILFPEDILSIIRTNKDIDVRLSEIALLFEFVPKTLQHYDLWAKAHFKLISKNQILTKIDAAAKNAGMTPSTS